MTRGYTRVCAYKGRLVALKRVIETIFSGAMYASFCCFVHTKSLGLTRLKCKAANGKREGQHVESLNTRC